MPGVLSEIVGRVDDDSLAGDAERDEPFGLPDRLGDHVRHDVRVAHPMGPGPGRRAAGVRADDPRPRLRGDVAVSLFVLAMLALGLILSAGVEVAALDPDIQRMNTVFKFYLHVWVIFGVAAAFGAWYVVDAVRPRLRLPVAAPSLRLSRGAVTAFAVGGAALVLAALVYAPIATKQRSLERFDFDSVLLPWNWHCAQHPTYAADFEATLGLCERRGVAVQTIKALARGPWAAGAVRNRETWYQPLEDEADIRAAVRWVLARPRLFLNSVGDVNLLPLVLQAADDLGPVPDDAVMARLGERAGLASIFGL